MTRRVKLALIDGGAGAAWVGTFLFAPSVAVLAGGAVAVLIVYGIAYEVLPPDLHADPCPTCNGTGTAPKEPTDG